MKPLRTGNLPMLARYGQVVGLALIWKWFYYAPNTMKEMYARREREATNCLLYTSPSPRDMRRTRMPSSA